MSLQEALARVEARYRELTDALSDPAVLAQPPEKLDYPMLAKIRDEGLNRSQVMDHISWLSDVYGPRLTGSPAILQASDWALKKFNEWGLVNGHREIWPFGKGWSLVRFSAQMIEPQVQPLQDAAGLRLRSWPPDDAAPAVWEVLAKHACRRTSH